jgi:uncharacterized protein YndB with AHSA1/START domain
METREILHEILINSSAAALYDALTDVKKLSHWWTTDVRGNSAVGARLEFWFSGFRGAVMSVTKLQADELVCWSVVDGDAHDWLGTELEFRISNRSGATFLHFRHSGWDRDAEAFAHCSMGWAIFLISLKEFVETGKGRPHPYDMPINLWRPPSDSVSRPT